MKVWSELTANERTRHYRKWIRSIHKPFYRNPLIVLCRSRVCTVICVPVDSFNYGPGPRIENGSRSSSIRKLAEIGTQLSGRRRLQFNREKRRPNSAARTNDKSL